MSESPNFFFALFALLWIRKCVFSLCFNNEGNGCFLEAFFYHSNHKNKMGIGNFMQILSLQLSRVLYSVVLFSSLESSFCSGEPWFLMRRCLASINQILKPHSQSWRCRAWTLPGLNKQMAEDSWYRADTPGSRRPALWSCGRKEFSGLGISPSFCSCWERLSLLNSSTGYFVAHGWLLSYPALT